MVCGAAVVIGALTACAALFAADAWVLLRPFAEAVPRDPRAVAEALVAALSRTELAVRAAASPAGERAVGAVALALPESMREGERALAATVMLVAAGAAAGVVLAASWYGALIGCATTIVLLAGRAHAGARAERARLETAATEAFQALAVTLGSGRSLAQALRYVGERCEDPVAQEFTSAAFALEYGEALGEVLDRLERSLSVPGVDLVATALGVSQRTGAPLQWLLEEASNMVADRVALERKLDVRTAQARMSARVVAAMPLVMVAFLGCFSPDFRSGLATATGAGSVLAAAALDLCAWLIIRKIMEVEL